MQADDTIARLRAALDEAEQRAWQTGGDHAAWVQRLAVRDRRLIRAWETAQQQIAAHVASCGPSLCSCRDYIAWVARGEAWRMTLEAAAGFWLYEEERSK